MAGALIKRAMSLELAIEEVWRCIVNDDVGIVGFYCTPGVEKPRLETEMNKIFHTTPRFDVVIWTSASRNFDVGMIQDQIGGKIGCTNESWEYKTVKEKAEDIRQVLSSNSFVVMLYNLWERVDLNEVGIPEPSHENGSKLIFITRSMDVSREMEARGEIKVVRFEPENVWGLFHERFGRNGMGGGSSRKIWSWIFLIANVVIEIISAVLDQLASVHKPIFALAAMIMAHLGLLGCMIDLVYKGKKQKAEWRRDQGIPWFYCPATIPGTYRRFGSLADIVGSVCALLESITAIVDYVYYSRHSENPFKVSLLPIVFAIGLLFSNFEEDRRPRVQEHIE